MFSCFMFCPYVECLAVCSKLGLCLYIYIWCLLEDFHVAVRKLQNVCLHLRTVLLLASFPGVLTAVQCAREKLECHTAVSACLRPWCWGGCEGRVRHPAASPLGRVCFVGSSIETEPILLQIPSALKRKWNSDSWSSSHPAWLREQSCQTRGR